MKTKILRLIIALGLASFGVVAMAAEPMGSAQTMVNGKFTLPYIPDRHLQKNQGSALAARLPTCITRPTAWMSCTPGKKASFPAARSALKCLEKSCRTRSPAVRT